MNQEKERKTLNISRYSSRRLYNNGAGDYVTVDDLAGFIREGHDIKVTDTKSGEDITGQILLQIIAEQQAETGNVLPINVLTDLVRHHYSEQRSIVPEFLSESFAKLKEHRKKLSQSLFDQMANPLDPKNAINSLEALRDVQKDIIGTVVSAWLPKDKQSSENQDQNEEDKQDSDLSEEVELLKKQMAEMQSKLEALKD